MKEIAQPHLFDSLLSEFASADINKLRFPRTPLGEIRLIQMRFAHGDAREWPELLARLEGIEEHPAAGLRLMVQAALQLYEDVTQAEADVHDTDPLVLESCCYAHAAQGVAYAQLGKYSAALEHLRSALTLGRALGLKSRTQNLELERLRVLNLLGDAQPDKVSRLLMQPMPTHRRQWGQRVLAEALMSRGAYREALHSLGTPDQDCAKDAALREWLHFLLQLPPARADNDPLLQQENDYLLIARAARGKLGRDAIDALESITSQPQAGYARLVQARLFWQLGRRDLAVRRLGQVAPMYPDQAARWHFNHLIAYADGLSSQPVGHMREIEQVLRRMRGTSDTTVSARQLPGNHVALMALSPFIGGEGAALLHQQPLLTGQTVVSGELNVRLPGRTGRTLVLEAAGVEVIDELTRMERKRLSEALAGVGGADKVANMGWVLRACGMLTQAAQEDGAFDLAQKWRESRDHAHSLLTADVQSALSMYPPSYLR